MDSKPLFQHEYHGDEAAGYEARRVGDLKWQIEDNAFGEFLAAAATTPAAILDIPVGTGRFLPKYVEAGHTVTGADISEDMLAEARAKLGTLGENHVTLEVADLTALPYADNSFDVAVCVRFLNLVDYQIVRTAFAELARVTRSELIVGLRTYDALAAPYQFIRRSRDRLTHRDSKVTPHPVRIIDEVVSECGLTLERKSLIHSGARRSSEYNFYLFRVNKSDPAR